MFKNTVGQDSVKSKLTFFIDCYKQGGVSPRILVVAPKGSGKTHFATLYGKCLEEANKNKKVRLVNCSSIKGVKGFFDSIVIPHIVDKDVTFIFDEASELPKDVTMALLTILNPNPLNATTFSYGDYTAEFSFRRQTFLFATSEPHKVFHALVDRLTRVDLQEYTAAQLGEVVQKCNPEISYETGLLSKIADTLRGNPRQATKMAINIVNFLGDKKSFSNDDWKSLCSRLGILSLGVNENEIAVLKLLSERLQCTLTAISASTGMTRACVQRDVETYLLKRNLIKIEAGGRCLTKAGFDFVDKL